MSLRFGSCRGCAALLAVALAILTGCAHFVVLHDPLTASEHSDLGVVYETTGELDLAAREYHRALRLDPHRAQARVNLGNVEAARGRWRGAEKCFRRALVDSSTNADAMNNLAMALLKQKRRLGEAQGLAERAVSAGGAQDSVYRSTLEEIRSAQLVK